MNAACYAAAYTAMGAVLAACIAYMVRTARRNRRVRDKDGTWITPLTDSELEALLVIALREQQDRA